MITLPEALAPAFAAALSLQHLTELFDSFLNRTQTAAAKKLKIGIASVLVSGVLLSFFPALRVLRNIRLTSDTTTSTQAGAAMQPRTDVAPSVPAPPTPVLPSWLDVLVSALIVSAGTDGFNSILKFINYKKEETKLDAGQASSATSPAAELTLPEPQLT